jgi:hypothetical protein
LAALAVGIVIVVAYVLWPSTPTTDWQSACRTVRHIVVNRAKNQTEAHFVVKRAGWFN